MSDKIAEQNINAKLTIYPTQGGGLLADALNWAIERKINHSLLCFT